MSDGNFTLGELAQWATSGSLRSMAKLLNNAGADPQLDEIDPDPGQLVPRQMVIDLLALRAGDRVGRVLGALLGPTA